MRSFVRISAVISVTLALLAGLWLPITARADAADPDGICGSLWLQTGQTPERVDAARAQPAPGHCLFCHLRHDMAGAFVSSVLQIISPLGSAELFTTRPIDRHGILLYDDAAPRGPPARS